DPRAGGVTTEQAPAYPPSPLLERGLDLFLPPTCVGCRTVGRWICTECWPATAWLPPRTCTGCGRIWIDTPCAHCLGIASSVDDLDAIAAFEGTAREAVHALKFHGHHAIHGVMGRIM